MARGFLGKAGKLGGVRMRDIDVGAEGVGVFAIPGGSGASEVHERVPKAAGMEKALAGGVIAEEAERGARGGAL